MPHVPYITSDDAFMAYDACHYWAEVRTTYVDPRALPMDLVVESIALTIVEPSEVEGETHVVTVADLDAAARRALDENLLGPTYAGYIAVRDIDGPTLDAVIQIAAFDGRVLFG